MGEKPTQRGPLGSIYSGFLKVFLGLDGATLAQAAASLNRIRSLDWSNVYASKGLRWEAIDHLKAPDGKSSVYSVRLTQKIRALAYRDGEFMRFISCTPTTTRPTSRR